MNHNRFAWWAQRRLWLGIACSVLFLFLAFRNVHWAALGATLQAVDWRYLGLATVVYILRLVAGGLRWRALLTPLGWLTGREAFAYLNIGHMVNNLLPLRAGEIIRAVLLGEKRGFSKSAVLATIVVDRLLDILVLVGLTFFLMLVMPVPPLVKQSALVLGGVGCLVVAGLWWVAGRVNPSGAPRRQGAWSTQYFGRFRGGKLSTLMQKVLRFGRSFASGLVAVRSPRQAGAAVGYSVVGWGFGVWFAWLVLHACHLQLPWTAALMVVVVVNFGAAIPSAPGFIGVMHFLAVVALTPWAVEQNAALGFAVVYHAQGFLITVGLGVMYLLLERASPRALAGHLLAVRAAQGKYAGR